MDEEEFVQEHSLESAQPKKRSRDTKKEEKRKMRRSSSVQEASPEGGKFSVQSPAIQLCHFCFNLSGETKWEYLGYSLTCY